MTDSFYVTREPNTRFALGRGYLQLVNCEFKWLETDDYDTWDECEREASTFTQFEAAILLQTYNSKDLNRDYNFEAVKAKT